VQAVLLGQNAQSHFVVGQKIIATGFLAKRSFKSTQLVMHINHIEYLS
jgi:primosomal replication protein N